MLKKSAKLLAVILILTLMGTGAASVLAAPPPQAEKTILEVATEDGRFGTLVQAVESSGFVETLDGEGPFTLFAPTDEAFANLPEDALNLPLEDILRYHLAPDRLIALDLAVADSVDTVLGESLNVTIDGDTVRINEAQIIESNIEASNGVIHVIDAVLMPPTQEEGEAGAETGEEEAAMTEPSQTILEVAREDGRFNTLVETIETSGLVVTLEEGSFTLFAPTDEAFAKLPERAISDYPLPVEDILSYHVVTGTLMATDAISQNQVNTLFGEPLEVILDMEVIRVNDAQVIETDIVAANGVIHAIDTVLFPPVSAEMEAVTTSIEEAEAPFEETVMKDLADVVCAEDYVVQADDWLSKIADKFYNDVMAYPAIFEATNAAAARDETYAALDDPNLIEIGQTLCIPSQSDAEVLLTGEEMESEQAEPMAEPTEEPMMEPTAEPTEESMVEPTPEPTEEPMMEPTEESTE